MLRRSLFVIRVSSPCLKTLLTMRRRRDHRSDDGCPFILGPHLQTPSFFTYTWSTALLLGRSELAIRARHAVAHRLRDPDKIIARYCRELSAGDALRSKASPNAAPAASTRIDTSPPGPPVIPRSFRKKRLLGAPRRPQHMYLEGCSNASAFILSNTRVRGFPSPALCIATRP